MTLSFISFAALLVNVIARISYGDTFFSSIKYAILVVKTFVLPDPAPAKTSNGPSVAVTAFFCISFSVVKSIFYHLIYHNIKQRK
ncbi:hypothetical protein D3C80_2096810 [compost metagenome]